MAKGKVHVYVKPKTEEAASPIGIIHTNAKGEIIKEKELPKKDEEIKVEELKEIVNKTIKNEEKAAENEEKKLIGSAEDALVQPKKKRGRAKKADAAADEKPKLLEESVVLEEKVGTGKQAALNVDQTIITAGSLDASGIAEEQVGGILDKKNISKPLAGPPAPEVAHAQKLHNLQEQQPMLVGELETNYSVIKPQAVQEEEKQIQLEPYLDETKVPSNVVEAALFMAGQAIDSVQLGRLIGISTVTQVNKMMKELSKKYDESGSAIEITEEAGGKWMMRVRASYAPAVRQFAGEAEISKHALKTLAFISKNDGITKRSLFSKLGSTIYMDVAELEEKGFVECVPHGRTSKVQTTGKFKRYFQA